MNGASLSLWLVLGQIIFSPDISLEKRLEKLGGNFKPAPGQTVTVDPFEKKNKGSKDPLDLRGFIDVTPPKGQCFLIRKKIQLPDIRVCEPTRLSYSMNELTLAGTIEWMLYLDERDTGTPLVWPSPYRQAQIMPKGKELQFGQYVPIEDCTAATNGERKIVLTLMNDTKIYIQFPETDKLVSPQPESEPNLYFNTKRKRGLSIDQSKVAATKKGGGGKEEKSGKKGKKKEASPSDEEGDGEEGDGEEGAPPANPGEVKTNDSKQGGNGEGDMRSSSFWSRKEQKKMNSKWIIAPRGAFEMSAALVSENGAPRGFGGKCRYRLGGAPEDPPSGFIECIPTDTYSHFIAHLSCANKLPPSKK